MDPASILLHVEYRSGGDAPLAFLLTFLKDGGLRFYSPRWKTYWAEMDRVEMKKLQTLLTSEEFHKSLPDTQGTGQTFGCCDDREVGLFLPTYDEQVALAFGDGSSHPTIMLDLVSFINDVGRRHFGGRYSLPIPEAGFGGE